LPLAGINLSAAQTSCHPFPPWPAGWAKRKVPVAEKPGNRVQTADMEKTTRV